MPAKASSMVLTPSPWITGWARASGPFGLSVLRICSYYRYCQMFYAGIFVRSLRIAADQGRLLLHQPSLGVAFAGLVDTVGRVAQQRRADSSSVINCKLQILVQHQARSRTLRVKAVPQHHGKA